MQILHYFNSKKNICIFSKKFWMAAAIAEAEQQHSFPEAAGASYTL
jgi:hypothetical protein